MYTIPLSLGSVKMGAYRYITSLVLLSLTKGALTKKDCSPVNTCLEGFHCCPDNWSCCMDDNSDDDPGIGKYVGIGFGCFAGVIIIGIIISCCRKQETVYRRTVTETVVHPPPYGSFGGNEPTTLYTETTYQPPHQRSFGQSGVSANPYTGTTYH